MWPKTVRCWARKRGKSLISVLVSEREREREKGKEERKGRKERKGGKGRKGKERKGKERKGKEERCNKIEKKSKSFFVFFCFWCCCMLSKKLLTAWIFIVVKNKPIAILFDADKLRAMQRRDRPVQTAR